MAKFQDKGNVIELEFTFSEAGDIIKIYSPGRWAITDKGFQLLPWEGHFFDHVLGDGVRIPVAGEVGWYVARIWSCVWKGYTNITQVR